MGDVLFYHLTRQPLEATLPMLLEKSLQRGWHVAVRGTSSERLKWLDERLWVGRDDGFLPHGVAGSGFDADQPVLLTLEAALPNGAQCLMLVDGAELELSEPENLDRVCVLFDGNDPAALQHARGQWKAVTGAGLTAQYWSEETGRWQMKAKSGD